MHRRTLSRILFGLIAFALVVAASPAFAGGQRVQRLLTKGRYGAAAKHWAKVIAGSTAGGAGNFTSGNRALIYNHTAARANKATVTARDGKRRYAPARYAQPNPRAAYLLPKGRLLPEKFLDQAEMLIENMLDVQAASASYRLGAQRVSARVTRSTAAKITIVTETASGRAYQRDFTANAFAGQGLKQLGRAKRIK